MFYGSEKKKNRFFNVIKFRRIDKKKEKGNERKNEIKEIELSKFHGISVMLLIRHPRILFHPKHIKQKNHFCFVFSKSEKKEKKKKMYLSAFRSVPFRHSKHFTVVWQVLKQRQQNDISTRWWCFRFLDEYSSNNNNNKNSIAV